MHRLNRGGVKFNNPVSDDYFTIHMLENGVVSFSASTYNNLSYSLNGSDWIIFSEGITASAGDYIRLKGDNAGQGFYYFYSIPDYPLTEIKGKISSTGDFEIFGNVMSLFYEDNFVGKTDLPDYALAFLFEDETHLVNAENLTLPPKCSIGCYEGLFKGCFNLRKGPQLPAEATESYCYYALFSGCTCLEKAPVLPARDCYIRNEDHNGYHWSYNCYSYMFCGCTQAIRIIRAVKTQQQ